ncbi:MAG: hypothetical protein ACOYOT_11700 [Bacteroidales bacterium]
MCKRSTIISIVLFVFVSLVAQNKNLKAEFCQSTNEELAPNDPRLSESPTRKASVDEVLDGSLKFKNPYINKLTYDAQGFDYSRAGKTPSNGIHPRIFTSPSEFAQVRDRLEKTKIGKMMLDVANRANAEMRDGKGKFGKVYSQLKNGEISTESAKEFSTDFVNQLTVQAYLAQLYNDKNVLEESGLVAGNFIRSFDKYLDALEVVPGEEHEIKQGLFWCGYLPKLYDFTAAGMKSADREAYLAMVSKNINGKYLHGMDLPPHWVRWNHMAMSLNFPLTLFSVENEIQVDKRLMQRTREMAENYFTYQYSPEGMSTEGMNYTIGQAESYNGFLAAMVRRGDKNYFSHPHFRKFADWAVYSMSVNPDGLWFTSGDTGSRTNLPWTIMMVYKYFFPSDAKVDYVFSNTLPKSINKVPDVIAYVFATDPDKSKETYNGVPPVEMPLTYSVPSRGAFIARNSWGRQAVKFGLEGRTDTYFISHDHSDRASFTLSGVGRDWVVDGFRSTQTQYHSAITIDGRGQGYFATPAAWLNYFDATEATFGVINYKYCYDWMWLKSPVADMMLGKEVSPRWKTGVYATTAKNLMSYYPDEKPQRDPLKCVADLYSGNIQTNPLFWQEDSWPMRLKNYPVEYAFRTAGLVKGIHSYSLIVDDIKKDSQEHLYEWNLPMPMDVELVSINQLADVEMQTSYLALGFNKITGFRKAGEYDIVLGDRRMKRDNRQVDNSGGGEWMAGRYVPAKGNPQLLVRVLDKMPASRPNLEPNPRLEVLENIKTEDMHQFYLRTMGPIKRLVVPSRSTSGVFKVLLFPYLNGDELPTTEWSTDRTRLTVSWSDQKDEFTFTTGNDKRTRVKLIRDGKLFFDL